MNTCKRHHLQIKRVNCAVTDCTEKAVTVARISINNRRKKNLPVCKCHADSAKEDARAH